MLHFNKALFPVFFAAFFLISLPLLGQMQMGMRTERYAGIYSAALNPAHTTFNPAPWDFSLGSADLFFQNNYAYVHHTSVQDLIRNSDQAVSILDTVGGHSLPQNAIVQDFFDKNRRFFGVLQAQITGPSFSFHLGAHHTFGFVSALRATGGAYGLPAILNYPVVSNLPRNEVNNIPRARIAGMAWRELGLHYSYRNDDGAYTIAFGITPKLLSGYEGFYVRANAAFDYTQRRGDSLAFARARWEYGLTTDQLSKDPGKNIQVNGHGLGVDLGFSIAQPLESGSRDYLWRVGISLIDAGWIRFNRQSEKHLIQFDQTVVTTPADFPDRNLPIQRLKDVSKAFLGDTSASLKARSFALGLPTVLSLQADFRLVPNVYLAAVWAQRAPTVRNSVRRPNTVALVPRYERHWFAASMPLVWSDWQFLRVGLSARLGYLCVGTDNLLSFTQQARLTGTDFYVGLKITGFQLHLERLGIKLPKYKKPSHYGPTVWQRMRIKCYNF
jgi:hypothetical protein